MHNVRHALRSIARMPAVTAVVVLSLAAGIGVNTVVFSWIQARVFKPIPGVSGASEFHLVEARTDTGMYPGVSWPEYRDLREGLRAFQALVAFRMAPLYVGEPGNVERAYGLLVSDNYFTALGLRPRLGRFPTAAEASSSGEPVAVEPKWAGTESLFAAEIVSRRGRTWRNPARSDRTGRGPAVAGFEPLFPGFDCYGISRPRSHAYEGTRYPSARQFLGAVPTAAHKASRGAR